MQTNNHCILIVEDSETQAVLLSAILESKGCRTECLATAEEALESLTRKNYSLIIVDYHLPGMNGDQFCRQVKMNINTRSIPVLMLTIEGSPESEKHALESGADAFASKELDKEILAAKIESLLGQPQEKISIRKEFAAFHSSSILAVDDSPTYLAFLEESFKMDGILLDMAQNGEAALKMIREKEYDCILLDLVMPGMDGIAVCKEISKLRSIEKNHFVVMMLSAHEGKEEMMKALEAGADDFVGKSSGISIIKAHVAALLRRSYIQKDNQKIWQELKQKELEAERARIEKEAAEEKALIATQLKKSEERFKKIFESNSDGVAILDRTGKLLMINSAAELLLGKTGYEILKTAIPFDMEKEDTASIEIEDDEGGSKFVEIKRVTIPWGEENACLISLHNVTERERQLQKTAEDLRETMRKLTDSQAQLIQSQKLESIGILTGGIAHDFNNLLTTIIGNAQMALADLRKEDPLHELIEEIKGAGDRAASLTSQLLTFSRKQIIQPEVLNLNDVVYEMDKMLKRLIGEDIELKTILSSDLNLVKADRGQIEQIIMNLAVNSRDAMPKGGKLTIETANIMLDEEYAQVHIAVKTGPYAMLVLSDTGIGMTKEQQYRIFEPFFTTKVKGKGTGLGLSTVYGIVKQSNGNIWVYSEPGKGTTFKVYLPRAEEKTVSPRKKADENEKAHHGSETIMLTEDEEMVRNLAVRALKRYGYTVLCAPDGQEALRICQEYEGPIHLMLTDVVMPGMSGRELAEKVHGLLPDMKVLYMSGYTDNTIVRHGVLEKGIAFIQKPFTPEGLAKKVREVLDRI